MGVNKVVYGGKTIVNMTDANVTSAQLLSGASAYNASGDLINGTLTTVPVDASLTTKGYAADAKTTGEELAKRITANLNLAETGDPNPVNADTLGGYSSDSYVRLMGATKPSLTAAQKTQLKNLALTYWNNRANFVYVGGANRNSLASSNNTSSGRDAYNSAGLIKCNCNIFAQLLWSGISPDSFLNKQSSYNGAITKTFDWGYYFKFPLRKFYNVTQSDGTPYGFVQPDSSTLKGAYSMTTYYSTNANNDLMQMPLSFMRACDMARELKFMGCEVPLSEAQPGDLVFMKAPRLDDNVDDESEKASYMNINHVAMVDTVGDAWGCGWKFIECSSYQGSGKAIIYAGESMSATSNAIRSVTIHDRIVMVARHPIAFGLSNAVPNTITAI